MALEVSDTLVDALKATAQEAVRLSVEMVHMADSSEKPAKKRGRGRPFQPGQSGNPGGKPKGFAALVRDRVGESGEKIVDAAAVLAWGTPTQVRAFFGEHVRRDAKVRMQAIEFLADRGFGKAPQEVSISGKDGGPVRVVFGGRYKPHAE